jgi:FtsZ-binding cell division protein ZapB
LFSDYNANMSEQTPFSPDLSDTEIESISTSVKRLTAKVQVITEAVKNLSQNRVQLEGKIEGAQKRIQHILSRLPEQSDGRQLNLLGEAIPPTNAEDDSEPTTH